jgi:hypothetical protein
VIPGIAEILHMLLSGQIDEQQAQAWIERHVELAGEMDGLRDHFAGEALKTVTAYPECDVATWAPSDFATHAYAIADAMLKEREAS